MGLAECITAYKGRVKGATSGTTPPLALAVPVATVSRSRTSGVSTFVTAAHLFVVGMQVVVTGMTDVTFNGTFTILTVPGGTSFTVANPGVDVASGADGGGTVTPPDRVFTGWHARELTGKDVVNDVRDNGVMCVIGLPHGRINYRRIGPRSVNLDLYIYKSKNTTWDGQDVCKLVNNVELRLIDQAASEYGPGSNAQVPADVGVDGYEYLIENCDGLLVVHMGLGWSDPEDVRRELREGS